MNELENMTQLVPSNVWTATRDNIVARAAQVTKVDDEATFQIAGAIDTEAKKAIKALSTVRLSYTRRIDAVKKNIIAQEKELARPLQEASERINKLLVAYYTEQARKREEEQRRIAEAQRKAAEAEAAKAERNPFLDDDVPETIPQPVPVPQTEAPRSSTNVGVKRIVFKIIDSTLVPREFCTPDSVLINNYLNMQKRSCGSDISLIKPIPGVQFSEEYQIRSR